MPLDLEHIRLFDILDKKMLQVLISWKCLDFPLCSGEGFCINLILFNILNNTGLLARYTPEQVVLVVNCRKVLIAI